MRTKIIYTLTSTEKDIYFEQALVSTCSCRMYNPDAEIILMVDPETNATLKGKRAEIDRYITRRVTVECPKGFSNKDKSRFVKTSIRQNIVGDFLFIDCDTVVCDSLADVDRIDADVAMVPDTHVKYKDYPFYDYMNGVLMELYRTDVSEDEYYFNSGAMFVRDTPLAHKLFEQWNLNWDESRKKGISTDQQALFKVNHDMGNVIKLLPGIYNCQIGLSLQYFYEAKVMHYFNSQMLAKTDMSPFFLRSFYEGVKRDGFITETTVHFIKTCKSQFISPSMIVSRTEMDMILSPEGHIFRDAFVKNGLFFKILSVIMKAKRKIVK